MRKHLFYLSMVLVLTLFSACGGGKKGVFTPTSSGRAYEVLVVVEPGLWERPAGRALFDVLDSDVPGLPQSERSFRIMYTAPSNYDATLKLIRNIIIVDVNKDLYTQPKFKYARNVYAAPQSILTIQAPDEASFEKFVEENRQVIIDFFTHAEMNRQISVLKDKHSDYIATKVKSQFDCDVWVPGELTSTKEGENFFWAGTNAATGDQNFVIYSYPYTDKDTFTKEYFVHKYYGDDIEVISSRNQELKIAAAKIISKINNCNLNEMLFVDDIKENIISFNKEGINAVLPDDVGSLINNES